jgi:hypothetical protein
LGIGDWAQSPIPNPQSPIPNPQSPLEYYLIFNFNLIFTKNHLYRKIKNKKILFKIKK